VAYNSEKIRTEADAKKMRTYIADGIKYAEQKSESAETKSNQAISTANVAKTVADNTNNRVENIIAHNGDETKDSEIVDSRYDLPSGKNYASLGQRLNYFSSELSDGKKQIEDIASVIAGDFDTLKEAVEYALSNNIKQISLGDKSYDVDESIVSYGKSLRFIGNGAKIIQKADIKVFDLVGGFKLTTTPTSINYNTGIDLSEESGGNTIVSRLDYSILPDVYIGDTVYIANPDENTYEFNRVVYIDTVNKYVYLASPLRNAYVAPNVSILNNCTLEFAGVRFDTDNATETWKNSFIYATNFQYVMIDNIEVIKACNSMVNLMKCAGYLVKDSIFANGRNKISGSSETNPPNVGYGVNDSGSSNGLVNECTFLNCRHGFTTNGMSYNAKVTNCNAMGCSGAGFDTHANCDNVQFVNCNVFGSYRGNRSDGTAFQARGKNIDFINCIADRCFKGFYLFEGFDKVKLKNCKVYNTWYGAVDIKGESRLRSVIVEDCYLEVLNKDFVLNADTAKLNIKNTELNNRSTVGVNYKDLLLINCDCIARDVKFNMENYGGTNGRFINTESDSVLLGEVIEFKQGASSGVAALIYGDNSANLNVQLKKVTGDFTNGNIYSLPTYALDHESQAIKSAIVDVSISNPGSSTGATLGQRTNDTIVMNVTSSSATASLKYFTGGTFIGQKLLIKNVGVNNFILDNTAVGTKIILSANRTLAPKQCALLIWDGSAWNCL
jgi:hypothetical protein